MMAAYQQLYEHLSKESKQIFASKYRQKFKVDPHDSLTVICSISFFDIISGHLRIISVGFGTKSLPEIIAKDLKGKVIKDMHAEVLARRGFIKFLLENMPKKKEENGFFEWEQKRQKHRLKENLRVIMFTNQVFCGDCMVDQGQNLFSGARPLKYFDQKDVPQQKFEKHCLRTKPGRLDLPLQKRSLSLSCSDKIALWNILGLQGKVLFNQIRPIYISAIFIQTNHCTNKQRIYSGINFQKRLQERLNISKQRLEKKLFMIKLNEGFKYISSQFHCHIPQLFLINNKTIKPQQNNKLNLCGIILQKEGVWLNGKTGLQEGVSLKKVGKLVPFCSEQLYKDIQRDEKEQFKYHAVKDRIKLLFGEWTTTFRQKN